MGLAVIIKSNLILKISLNVQVVYNVNDIGQSFFTPKHFVLITYFFINTE